MLYAGGTGVPPVNRTPTTRFAGGGARATRSGYSWGTAPGTSILMYEPAWDDFAKVWAK